MDVALYGIYAVLFLGLYFEVFLFVSFFEKLPPSKTADQPARFPLVSMIVPCFNEERTLAGTVESLLALNYPQDKLEILIVNDGSKDNTGVVGERLAQEHFNVHYFSKPNGGKWTAVNFGIEHAQGELIGCLDADSFVAAEALSEMVKKFESDPEVGAVVPAMRVRHPKNMLELMQSAEYTFGIFVKKTFDNLSAISVLPGPFSIYRRSVFEKIGMFRHAHNTEDMEMAFRMHENHLKIANAHTAVVYTNVPPTLRKLVKQRTRWAQGFLQNSQDYWHMYFNPRFGNFGMLVLPFGLVLFIGALYSTAYLIIETSMMVSSRVHDIWVTGIFPQFYLSNFSWFYLNTSMLTFLIITTVCMTIAAILIGRKMAGADFGVLTIMSYVMLYGFIAPLWLMRAAWGTLRAQESVWDSSHK
jgi:cellulose synthase/poly-beta-1,6-N-acetylglucosamine synthase-like glycosyltransferase